MYEFLFFTLPCLNFSFTTNTTLLLYFLFFRHRCHGRRNCLSLRAFNSSHKNFIKHSKITSPLFSMYVIHTLHLQNKTRNEWTKMMWKQNRKPEVERTEINWQSGDDDTVCKEIFMCRSKVESNTLLILQSLTLNALYISNAIRQENETKKHMRITMQSSELITNRMKCRGEKSPQILIAASVFVNLCGFLLCERKFGIVFVMAKNHWNECSSEEHVFEDLTKTFCSTFIDVRWMIIISLNEWSLHCIDTLRCSVRLQRLNFLIIVKLYHDNNKQ